MERNNEECVLVAIGGVWLDEIRAQGKPALKNVLGGSVTFATIGARLFAAASPGRPAPLRLIFIAGHDFPPDALELLRSWNVNTTVHWRVGEPSARGIVHYEDHEDDSKRSYERLTSPLSTNWTHLTSSDIANSTAFHFFETPDVTSEGIQAILGLRTYLGFTARPLIIWEPQAKSCSAATLENHLTVAKHVDVFSPNHAELRSFFCPHKVKEINRTEIEQQASHFITSGIGPNKQGCIIVRAAEQGCLVMQRDSPPTWLPAFHSPASGQVIDPTGAGNAFLGGLAVGFNETQSFCEAAKYGAVAASFVVEQVGLPTIVNVHGEERWNGHCVRERLRRYRGMCA